MSRDFVSSLIQRGLSLAKLGGHESCENGDLMFFYLSRDHVIEVPCDFVRGLPSS